MPDIVKFPREKQIKLAAPVFAATPVTLTQNLIKLKDDATKYELILAAKKLD